LLQVFKGLQLMHKGSSHSEHEPACAHPVVQALGQLEQFGGNCKIVQFDRQEIASIGAVHGNKLFLDNEFQILKISNEYINPWIPFAP
jgi:hypothetical protein